MQGVPSIRSGFDDPKLCAPLKILPSRDRQHDDELTATDVVVPGSMDRLLLLCRVWIAGKVLELGIETKFTSLVLLHRYWNAKEEDTHVETRTSVHEHCEDWKWVAAACLFLACKAEEEPRRLRDVINVAVMLQFGIDDYKKNQQHSHVTNLHSTKPQKMNALPAPPIPSNECNATGPHIDGEISDNSKYVVLEIKNDPPPLDDTYWQAKEQLIATEQVVLRWLHFDVLVAHPHRMVLIVIQELAKIAFANDISNTHNKSTTFNEQWSEKAHDHDDEILHACNNLVSLSWQRLNDTLFHSPALTHPAIHMACVAISLAANELLALPSSKRSPSTPIATTPSTTRDPSISFDSLLRPNLSTTTSNMAATTSLCMSSDDQYPVSRQQKNKQCRSSTSMELAVLGVIRNNPSWFQRYDVSNQEFQATYYDMCQATKVLERMSVSTVDE